jgi:hypothetical protein
MGRIKSYRELTAPGRVQTVVTELVNYSNYDTSMSEIAVVAPPRNHGYVCA